MVAPPGLIQKIDEGVKRIVNIGHEFNRKGYGYDLIIAMVEKSQR